MSTSHQKYTAWASMTVYRLRAHEPWLNTSMEEAARLYDRGSTSRSICHSHAMMFCKHHQEVYTSASDHKGRIFFQWSALSTGRLLAKMWAHWVTVTRHWKEVA